MDVTKAGMILQNITITGAVMNRAGNALFGVLADALGTIENGPKVIGTDEVCFTYFTDDKQDKLVKAAEFVLQYSSQWGEKIGEGLVNPAVSKMTVQELGTWIKALELVIKKGKQHNRDLVETDFTADEMKVVNAGITVVEKHKNTTANTSKTGVFSGDSVNFSEDAIGSTMLVNGCDRNRAMELLTKHSDK